MRLHSDTFEHGRDTRARGPFDDRVAVLWTIAVAALVYALLRAGVDGR
jgi:hypothetical protein